MGRLARARLGGCGPSFCGAVGGLDVVWLQPRSWSGAGRCGGCWACVVPARCLSCPACAGSTAGTNGARVARAGVPGPSQRRTTLCAQMRCGARPNPRQVPLRNQRPPEQYGAATTRWGRLVRLRAGRRDGALLCAQSAIAAESGSARCRRGGDCRARTVPKRCAAPAGQPSHGSPPAQQQENGR